MTSLYLWKPFQFDPRQTVSFFSKILADECQFLERALGRPCSFRVKTIGGSLIGQIATAVHGVRRFTPWSEVGEGGVAWSGVCEDYLDVRLDQAGIDALQGIGQDAKAFSRLTGRFVLCTWHEGTQQILCTTGSTESPAFWSLEGPQGYAAGNRIAPLHHLAGCRPELAPESARLFLAFEYHAGDGCFFRRVKRVKTGSLIRIERDGPLSIKRLVSLGDILDPRPARGLTPEHIDTCSAHMHERARLQLRYSEHPVLLLTGGMDSRCVGVAITGAGFKGTAITSGPPASNDVRIGRMVANALGVEFVHARPSGRRSAVHVFLKHRERLHDWLRLTEGIDTIRHALPHQVFFRTGSLSDDRPPQLFHGTHELGGLVHLDQVRSFGGTPTEGRDIAGSLIPRDNPFLQPVAPLLGLVTDELWSEMKSMPLDLGQKLHLFAWQRRSQQFVGNTLSIADQIHWHWAPLLDRLIIQTNLQATSEERETKALIRRMTDLQAPQLRDIPYNSAASSRETGVRKYMGMTAAFALGYNPRFPYLGKTRTRLVPIDRHLREFWQQILFRPGAEVWREFLKEDALRLLAIQNPLSDFLWRAASLQLFAESFLGETPSL